MHHEVLESEQGRLIYRKNITEDLAVFRFECKDKSNMKNFEPGQFVNLGLKIDETEIIHRPYSISSSPNEKKYYEFYIKHKEHPTLGKFTTALFKMNLEESVFLQSPRGSFTIEKKKPNETPDTRHMILVCSGTGLAPFMSYIRHLKNTDSRKKVTLVHGVSYARELGYRDFLEKLDAKKNECLDFTYIPTVSRPNDKLSEGWNGNTGRAESIISGIEKHESKLEKDLRMHVTPDNSIVYICGYKTLIEYIASMLSPLGFVDNRHKRKDGTFDIKYELYGV